MKNFRFILILLLATFMRYNAVAQPDSFYYEFPVVFNDSVAMYFQQNTFQISDSTYLSTGNYGVNFYGLAGRVIWDSYGNVIDAKYLDVDNSFYLEGLARIDDDRFLLYGQFDFYHETSGNLIDHAAAMVCFNQNGDVLWQNYYGAIKPDGYPYPSDYSETFLNIIKDEANQKLYCLGISFSYDPEHEGKPYVVCTDYDGDTIWTWVMPDFVNQNMGSFTDAVLTENGELICVGQIAIHEDRGYNGKNLIVKLSADGELVWSKLWGISNVYSAGVINIGNNEFIVTSEESEIFLDTIMYGTIYKFNGDGDSISKISFLKNRKYLWIKDIVPTSEGFAILGMVNFINNNIESSAIFVAKYDHNLVPISTKGFNVNFNLRGISQTFDNSLLLTGSSGSDYGNCVIKTDSLLNIPLSEIDLFIPISQRLRDISYYPNPVSDLLYIELEENETIKEIKIYDIYGRVILTKKTSENRTTIDVSNIEHGLYILETNNVYVGKIVIN